MCTLKSGDFEAVKEKIFDEDEADRIVDKCSGADANVTSVIQTRKSVNPPKLFDLTTLQREANRYLGLTAQQTLRCYAVPLREEACHLSRERTVGFLPKIWRILPCRW